MPLSTSGLTQVPAPVNFVLMKGLLRMARNVLPYFNGTVPGEIEKFGGSMSVKWRRFAELAVATTALGEAPATAVFGMGRNSVTPTVTDITVAVAKYGNAILYAEELDLFNVNSRAADLMTLLGRNAGDTLNTLMRNVYNAETTVIFSGVAATTLATVKAPISSNNIKDAVNRLENGGATPFTPQSQGSVYIGSTAIREAFFGIVHVDQEEDIRGLANFTGVERYASQVAVKVGEFGIANGVRWCSTRSAPVLIDSGAAIGVTGCRSTTGTLIDVYSWFVYGEQAIGTIGLGEQHAAEIYELGEKPATVMIIDHPIGTSGVGDMMDEIGSIAWKAWFAGKVLNSAWIVKGQSGAAKLVD